MRFSFGLLAAGAALLSCSDPLPVTERTAYVEPPHTTWPGAGVVVSSQSFVLDSGVILVDDHPAPATLVDETRRRVAMPDSVGVYDVSVVFGLDTVVAGSVTVTGGFLSWDSLADVPRNSAGFPAAWPDPDGRRIVLVTEGLVSLDLAHPHDLDTLLTAAATDDLCGQGPTALNGTLTLPGARIGPGACSWHVAWRDQDGSLVAFDSTSQTGVYAARVADDRWIVFDGHTLFQRRSGSSPAVALSGWGGRPFVVSPAGDRLAPALGGGTPVPLFDPHGITEIASHTPASTARGAEFSPDGDTLFMLVGNDYVSLTAFAAEDGALLSQGDSLDGEHQVGTLPARITALVIDRGRPWMYVVGDLGATGPIVVVADRRTMRIVARLAPRAGEVPLGGDGVTNELHGDYFGFVDADARRLYVLQLRRHPPDKVYTFQLLP